MKVLYVISGTNPFGGATKAFYNLCCGVKKRNIVPFVFCPGKDGIYEILKDNNISVKASTFRFSSWPGYTGKDLLLFIPRVLFRIYVNTIAFFSLLNYARIIKPDIIHSNVSVIDIGYLVARCLRIPHIWHVREYGLADFNIHVFPSYSVFKKRLNNTINHCICITNGIKEYHHLNDLNSTVVYDGVMSEHEIRYTPNKKNYYLFAGRLEKTKGVELCIDAFKNYIDTSCADTELWIAGAPIQQDYLDYLSKLSLGYPIRFLGARKDIFELMYEAKALIVSSENEGFGFITAEAMFNGCLVLGRNTAGTKEQMDNGLRLSDDEIAMRFDDEAGLIDLLKQVDKYGADYYYGMVKRSQEIVAQLYSTEAHLSQVIHIYNNHLMYIKNKNEKVF